MPHPARDINASDGLPRLFTLAEAAHRLRVSAPFLRARLRDRTFGGVKMAGRWLMTVDQIDEAIATMTSRARATDTPSPAGLPKNSRLRRRIQRKGTAL
jgi:hypothetical protein